MNMKPMRAAFAAALGVSVGMVANAASFNPFNIDLNRAGSIVKNLGTAASPLPEKDEIALGRELAGRTMGAAPLIQDRALQAYVNRVGRSIAAHSERADLPWKFGVVDSPSINAFASPGGIILITRGLYEILDNEAQLAGVIGHEIAHVEKYHHANVVRKQAGTAAIAGIGQEVVAQRASGVASPLLQQLLGSGAELFAKKLDRSAETEADDVGAVLAAKAGYSPSGLIDVLHKLNARAGEPSMNLLYATHPHPSERLTALGDALAPKMASLPEGEEPPLLVAASSLPEPTLAAGQAAPAPGRALSGQEEPQQAQTGISGLGSGYSGSGQGVGPGGAGNANSNTSGGGGGAFDPGSLLRGIMGR
jgi:predicted Zn-dependent protease